jgi:hypothetical protein
VNCLLNRQSPRYQEQWFEAVIDADEAAFIQLDPGNVETDTVCVGDCDRSRP